MNLTDIVRVTKEKGGVSYSLYNNDMANTPNYALSIYKDKETIIPLDEFNDEYIKQFIFLNGDILHEENVMIGTWVHEGNVYLDIALLYPKDIFTSDVIKNIARDNKQLAYFDLETMQSIYEHTLETN